MRKILGSFYSWLRKGSTWRDGACTVGFEHSSNSVRVAWQVLCGTPTLGGQVNFRSFGDGTVDIDFGVPGLRFFLSWEGRRLPGWLDRHIRSVQYRYGIEFAALAQWHIGPDFADDPLQISWNIGMDPDTHKHGPNGDPWWRRGSVSVFDLLFGRLERTELSKVCKEVEIPLPEGPVLAKMETTKRRWSRPRFVRPHEFTTVYVDFKPHFVTTGHPKHDGFYGQSLVARNLEDGIGKVVGGIIAERLQNGLRADGTDPKEPESAIRVVAAERQRQIGQEGWEPRHDDCHKDGSMAMAAACYAAPVPIFVEMPEFSRNGGPHRDAWPWDPIWDKRAKHSRLRQLVIAGALILAEVDRLRRAGLS